MNSLEPLAAILDNSQASFMGDDNLQQLIEMVESSALEDLYSNIFQE